MSNHQLFRFAGWVGGSLLVCACAGKPTVDDGGETNHVGGAKNGSTGTTTAPNNPFGQAGTGSTGINVGNPNDCKQTCEVGECGPVSNGCGSLIECGTCTLPATCGGAGIPSHCGVSTGTGTCTPTTCEALGATCGLQSDGCGGILDCWSATAKASGAAPACEVAGNQCINGTCKATVPECTKKTCNDYASQDVCGPVSDGCSGVLDCGFGCATTERCENSKCVAACTPLTCEQALVSVAEGNCDVVPDGCGGIIPNCQKTTCTGGATCGGAGDPGVCGVGTVECPRLTAASCGDICGKIPDGCGGEVTCPTACTGEEVCMGTPGHCDVPATSCTPTTCAAQGADCGQIPDGCEGFLTCGSNNGNCEAGKTCGSGNKCISTSGCTALTQAEVCTAGKCGVQSAGCGDITVDCGGCPQGQSCGAGGPSLCGVPTSACVPLSAAAACAYAANSCGPQSDGCGGSVTCTNTCAWPERCTGNPTKCAVPTIPGCTNLCPYIDTTCTAPTQLTGTVYAPEGTIPLYNALVYVPNATLPAITTGRSCERCEDENLGSPLAAARTGADGTFTLKNVPAGKSFPLVIKMGKWRRVVTIPARQNCSTTALTKDQTRLPKNATTDADTTENRQYLSIPKFAVVTGKVDAMECVLKKMGVDQAEFTRASGTGRIHMYRAPVIFNSDGSVRSGGGGVMGCSKFRTGSTTRCATARDADVLYDSLDSLFSGTNLDKYDVAVFDCEGSANDHDSLDPKLLSWANAGGRVFSSHYSYKYLDDNGSFANSAVWQSGEDLGDQTTGIIDKAATNPKGAALNTWLGIVNGWSSTYGSGYISITDPRDRVKSVNAGSERFIYLDTSVRIGGTQICDANSIQQYAFNTPYNASAANICGRVLYSAFHVADVSAPSDKVFPSYCSTGALTPQEKTLMFMLFDLSACVSVGEPPSPPTCTKNTCEALGANCGSMPDGCGGLLNCGTCTAPDTCGGGGTANVCGSNCTRTTCGAQGANCGKIADGCGGLLECGTCDAPATCGGAGTPNVCGTAICTPRTCISAGAECGYIADGCGGIVECGECSTGTCGGGGTPNKCAVGTCTPSTSCGTAKCGYVSDGCGGTVDCEPCPTGYTCVAGACIGSNCTPRTCSGIGCGFIGDGCGGVVDCGACTVPGQTCGGGGTPSQCGGSCDAITCDEVGAECGAISNGCGGITDCGICATGYTCGALSPNKCGIGSCVKRTCASVNATCGEIGDGCGGVLECGVCTVAGQSCGGGGVPNQCGTGGCVLQTCGAIKCGPAADGCGGLLDCGTCPAGQTCGGGGTPGVCGSSILY